MTSDAVIDRTERVRKRTDVLGSPLGDGHVLLDLEGGCYVGLDEIGAEIWRLLDTPASVAELADQLAGQFAAPAGQIEADILPFVQTLAERKLIERAA